MKTPKSVNSILEEKKKFRYPQEVLIGMLEGLNIEREVKLHKLKLVGNF